MYSVAVQSRISSDQSNDTLERDKTSVELAVIEQILPCINEFVLEYGGSALPLQAERIRILNESLIPGFGSDKRFVISGRVFYGCYRQSEQKVLIAHYPDLGLLQFTQTLVRELLRLHGPDESLIEGLTKQFDARYFATLPALQSEVRTRARHRLAFAQPGRIAEDDIAYVIERSIEKTGTIFHVASYYQYEKKRKVFNSL